MIGRCVGNEPISLGDFLNDFQVVKIEAYGKELPACPPGFTARLTLSFAFREEKGDASNQLFLLTLSEYKFDRGGRSSS
jgi:hypothetical protein